MTVAVGDKAPSFRLPATGGVTIGLDDYAGENVVLVFYPGDDSPVCTKQLTAYNNDFEEFAALDAVILGISPQDIDSHESFAGKHGFKMPLLADTDKEVAAQYGILGPLGFPRRSVFIIDRDGIVRYVHRAIAGMTFRPVSELVAALRAVD